MMLDALFCGQGTFILLYYRIAANADCWIQSYAQVFATQFV